MPSTVRRPVVAQRSFAELGDPLVDATFVVLDFETTGGSPREDRITEVGAVKVRGGEVLGTFATLVNPGRAVPPTITVLTGITSSMVARAPRIEEVLGSLVDFLGTAVVVGHNVRFDLGFLAAALERDSRPALTNRHVDTAALARRLLREEVPDCRLGTLAERLRLPHRPSHRALEDAWATVDLLHVLLERAGGLGVTGLEDLEALPTVAGHPQAAKLRLTERLPRSPGVYLFRNQRGHVLYVGKATDLRSRVRSYFSNRERRKVGALLRETGRIDHKVCPNTLEAEVLESRLIRHLTPPYNSQGTRWRRACYLRLTTEERFPRLSVVREPRAGDRLVLGPLPSRQVARLVAEAIESAVPLRRCTERVPNVPTRSGPCAPAQLGVATCPCAGAVSEADYDSVVRQVIDGVERRPERLLEPLEEHMSALAGQERYEEAALARDRMGALATALSRRRALERLVGAERLVVRDAEGVRMELRHGVLWQVWAADPGDSAGAATSGGAALWGASDEPGRAVEMRPDVLPEPGRPVAKGMADELAVVSSWLERTGGITLEAVDGTYSSPLPAIAGTLRPLRPRPARSPG